MSSDTPALRVRRDRTYGRLSHQLQQQLDRECAERVVELAADPRAAKLLELRRTQASQDALAAVSRELGRAIEDPARDRDPHAVCVAIAAEHSAHAAAQWRHPNIAPSDCPPTSANEAYKARYLEALVRCSRGQAESREPRARLRRCSRGSASSARGCCSPARCTRRRSS